MYMACMLHTLRIQLSRDSNVPATALSRAAKLAFIALFPVTSFAVTSNTSVSFSVQRCKGALTTLVAGAAQQ